MKLKSLLLTLFLVVGLPPAVHADNIFDFVREVFQEAVEVRDAVQIQAIAQPVQPQLPPNELKARETRLEAYAQAMKSWVVEKCELSAEQEKQVDELIAGQIERAQQTFEKKQADQREQNRPTADHAPLRFTSNTGCANQLRGYRWDKHLRDILTDEQRTTYKEAIQQRQQVLRQQLLESIVAQIDEELYLTSKQRDRLLQELDSRMPDVRSQLYTIRQQSYYLSQTSLSPTLQRLPDEFLTKAQQQRLKDLANSNQQSERYVMFSTGDSNESWAKQLSNAVENQKDRMQRVAMVRLDYMAQEYGLSERDTHILQVAAKGTAIKCLQKWKKQTQSQLANWEQHRRAGQNFSFAVNVPQMSEFDNHELWNYQINKFVSNTGDSPERDATMRHANAAFITAQFDMEMWLSDEQRDKFLKLVESTLPEKSDAIDQYIHEYKLMAIPLFRLSESDLKGTLNPQQIEIWKLMKSYFQQNGRNIQIQFRNGGTYGFTLPR